MENGSSVQVIARAFTIIRILRGAVLPLSLGEIARQSELPKSTVQRIVASLIDEAVVEPAKRTKGFRLGAGFYSLTVQTDEDVKRVLKPLLLELSQLTEETIDLARLSGRQLVFIDQIQGKSRLSAVSAIGETFPLTNTANGRSILKLMTAGERAEIYDFEQLDPQSIAAAEGFLNEEQVPWLGLDQDSKDEGISAMGLGFRVHTLGFFAISVVAPSRRFLSKIELIRQGFVKAQADLVGLGFEP